VRRERVVWQRKGPTYAEIHTFLKDKLSARQNTHPPEKGERGNQTSTENLFMNKANGTPSCEPKIQKKSQLREQKKATSWLQDTPPLVAGVLTEVTELKKKKGNVSAKKVHI